MSLAFPWVPDLMQIIIDRYCKTPGGIFNFFFFWSRPDDTGCKWLLLQLAIRAICKPTVKAPFI